MSNNNNGPSFVLFQCNCGCGKVTKIDISKYSRKVQKGLRLDYGIRPAPIQSATNWTPHKCKDCGQTCKAPNGHGTQKALEIERFGEVHQYIMRSLASLGKANVDELRLFVDVNFGYKTTANTLHSRISDLIAWKIIISESVEDVPTKPTGLDVESSNLVVYSLDLERAEIVEKDDWQTWRLRAIDGGLSFQLDGFGSEA